MNSDAACTPKKESEVQGQMGILDNKLHLLSEEIESLEQRLSIVCRQPSSVDFDDNKPSELVPLAATLRAYVSRLQEFTDRMRDLKERIEV